ncbi:predicted protein [Plenodomus lingam JN3]|uniref:Predicted protein n=1 Tax=Leptosphaeria maculans (strain JN3 / isolate v23.1.3 / race Av1-4-5-6-7-8) TaxID=985895 RepID=E4ZI80_LEPMJ|nr:predicted protein [Plenodomus lingam JN3]CBX90741.1 predicted protein [Plenodomus lingam JN3]
MRFHPQLNGLRRLDTGGSVAICYDITFSHEKLARLTRERFAYRRPLGPVESSNWQWRDPMSPKPLKVCVPRGALTSDLLFHSVHLRELEDVDVNRNTSSCPQLSTAAMIICKKRPNGAIRAIAC